MKNPRKIQKGSESMNEKDEKKAPQTFSVRTDLAIEHGSWRRRTPRMPLRA